MRGCALTRVAHFTAQQGFALGQETAKASAPRDQSALIRDLQANLEQMSSIVRSACTSRFIRLALDVLSHSYAMLALVLNFCPFVP